MNLNQAKEILGKEHSSTVSDEDLKALIAFIESISRFIIATEKSSTKQQTL